VSRFDDWPPRAQPRRVEGGIKARTKRGAFGQGAWAKRWIAVLERFPLGGRLARGRAYARGGQVIDIAMESGGVRASVQGSRPEPYAVTIRIHELTATQWADVGAAISANTRLGALLLAGEMPEDIEAAFASAGATLFPSTQKELTTECSCPDSSNPCKHVAAVFYLIGEEFDRDPFLLFVVRGLARDAVRSLLATEQAALPTQAAASAQAQATEPALSAASTEAAAPGAAAVPALVTVPANGNANSDFWGSAGTVAESLPPRTAVAPAVDAILLRKAGHFPFWRADETLEDALTPAYARATETALAWLAEHPEG
jgi:uncharacterized Zn finger protein